MRLACIFTDTRHPIAIGHVRARAFPSYNFEIMQKERASVESEDDRGTRWYVTDYRAECRVLCQGGCHNRLHLPHESPGNTWIYLPSPINYPFPICPPYTLPSPTFPPYPLSSNESGKNEATSLSLSFFKTNVYIISID